MPKGRQRTEEQEPVGIVISRGPSVEPTPRFSAYIYSNTDEVSAPIETRRPSKRPLSPGNKKAGASRRLSCCLSSPYFFFLAPPFFAVFFFFAAIWFSPWRGC